MTKLENQDAVIHALIRSHQAMKGALLPLLHAIQDAIGYIPPDSVESIAKGLNLSRAEVHGVITYYHYFRMQAAGQHTVQICVAEACQACGANDLMAQAESLLGCKAHQTNPSGSVTLMPVYCLGLCASSPAIAVDEKLHARVSATKMEKILNQLEVSQ